jgi:hypothetical protein
MLHEGKLCAAERLTAAPWPIIVVIAGGRIAADRPEDDGEEVDSGNNGGVRPSDGMPMRAESRAWAAMNGLWTDDVHGVVSNLICGTRREWRRKCAGCGLSVKSG